MKNPTTNERSGLSYAQVGGYSLPDLTVPADPKIGKYGRILFRRLRDHRACLFNAMLLDGTLNAYLEETDRQANEMLDLLTRQMAEREGVTERLKANDQMDWVRRMNNIRNRAEEVVLHELIYN
ncbi:MAG: TnpV protein [Oscillospiraceae bacterium]|nr:TnpV protein [Oscillospiraceae bacterium]